MRYAFPLIALIWNDEIYSRTPVIPTPQLQIYLVAANPQSSTAIVSVVVISRETTSNEYNDLMEVTQTCSNHRVHLAFMTYSEVTLWVIPRYPAAPIDRMR